MDINEALGIAKQLKNHFRAFEKLDDFVKETASLMSHISVLQEKKASLLGETTEIEKRYTEAKGVIDKAVADKRQEAENIIAALDKEIRENRESVGGETRRLKTEEVATREALSKAKDDYAKYAAGVAHREKAAYLKVEAEHVARMEELNRGIREAEKRLAETKDELDRLRKRLG